MTDWTKELDAKPEIALCQMCGVECDNGDNYCDDCLWEMEQIEQIEDDEDTDAF